VDAAPTAIGARYRSVLGRVASACERSGRDANDVTVVAVSKTFSGEVLQSAIEAGVTELGENRAQELKNKVGLLGDRARWHFVGPLQTNKVRVVVGAVALIHSVDRLELAEAIARRARAIGIEQKVLIEVNLSGEATKHGTEPAGAGALARAAAAIKGIVVAGWMTMPPFAEDPDASRPYFRQLATLAADLASDLPEATELSMGMSRDFEVGVEEGATLVRIGEAIFGSRRHHPGD
jgi:PLP dependent protein